jgi:hypothetical protein
MIVDKVWKLTNAVKVGLDPRSSHTQRQSTFPDNVCSCYPPCHGVSHYENLTTFLFFWKFFFNPQESASAEMVKSDEKTNTGEGSKGKRGRTASDDAGGKSLSETYKSARGQCVGENSTGAKSAVIRSSVNIFQVSKRDKPQYFVDVVKDKRKVFTSNLLREK